MKRAGAYVHSMKCQRKNMSIVLSTIEIKQNAQYASISNNITIVVLREIMGNQVWYLLSWIYLRVFWSGEFESNSRKRMIKLSLTN